MSSIIIFTICSIINVGLSTVRTIIMYDRDKLKSSIVSAVYFGFYTVMVVLLAGDLSLWVKIAITVVTNFGGTYLGSWIMEKLRKDKLWRIEATVPTDKSHTLTAALTKLHLSYSTFLTSDSRATVFFIYSKTQKESHMAREILKEVEAKFFVSEDRGL